MTSLAKFVNLVLGTVEEFSPAQTLFVLAVDLARFLKLLLELVDAVGLRVHVNYQGISRHLGSVFEKFSRSFRVS